MGKKYGLIRENNLINFRISKQNNNNNSKQFRNLKMMEESRLSGKDWLIMGKNDNNLYFYIFLLFEGKYFKNHLGFKICCE